MTFDGTYDVFLFTSHGEAKDKCIISMSDQTITGIYSSEALGNLPLKYVKVDGNHVEWTLYFSGPNKGSRPPENIIFDVIFEDNQFTGKVLTISDPPFNVKGIKVY
jgi:hypothetical protein